MIWVRLKESLQIISMATHLFEIIILYSLEARLLIIRKKNYKTYF